MAELLGMSERRGGGGGHGGARRRRRARSGGARGREIEDGRDTRSRGRPELRAHNGGAGPELDDAGAAAVAVEAQK